MGHLQGLGQVHPHPCGTRAPGLDWVVCVDVIVHAVVHSFYVTLDVALPRLFLLCPEPYSEKWIKAGLSTAKLSVESQLAVSPLVTASMVEEMIEKIE